MVAVASRREIRAASPVTVCLLAVCLVAVPLAHAQDATRVVLLGDDGSLGPALEATLAPWHVSLVVLDAATPGDSMPSSSSRGRALAETNDAAAIVWISRDESGATALWIYDRAADRVLARPLPASAPFDEATAAAVALSVKTLLRHSGAAPVTERVLDPPIASEVRLEIGAGISAFATSSDDPEARVVLAGSFWPRVLGSALGIGVSARSGSGTSVSSDRVTGRLWTAALLLRVEGRYPVDRWLDLGLGLELGASLAFFDGVLHPGSVSAQSTDVDPSGYAWGQIGIRPISALRIFARVGAFGVARTRSYVVRGQSVLDTQPIALAIELGLELPLDGGIVDGM
jgi:hypothetical protein